MKWQQLLLSNIPREGENQNGSPPPNNNNTNNNNNGNPPPAAWHTGLDAELIGHAQNRGWHDKKPDEVAREAVKAHREAEKLIGVPADRIIRLPQNANDADAMRRDVWSRLGVPADAKEYDFSTVKRANGNDLDTALADTLRNAAFANTLTKNGAVEVAKAVVKHLDAIESSTVADRTAKTEEGKAELAKNWGTNGEINLFHAKQGAAKLGFDEATVTALESVVGYAKIMEALRRVGASGAEAKFVDGGTQNGGPMTKEQAVARKDELMRDTAWTKRYLEGGTAEVREMTALNTLISA